MNNLTLKNNRLTITLADKTYTGTRFDHMGMIEQVTLDNVHTFCTQESLIAGIGSNGQGLYNEFGIEEPIGYNDAVENDLFPKVGVGMLTKENNAPYDFFHTYPCIPVTFEIDKGDASIKFSTTAPHHRGYAYHYSKTLSLTDNKLSIQYHLTNTGTKPIDTTEYCHNFIAINHHPITEDYEVTFSYPVQLTKKLGDFKTQENSLFFETPLDDVLYCQLCKLPSENEQFFEVIHKPSGVGVRETHHFPLERVAVWGMPHVISPEAFIRISLLPGETISWERTYTFFDTGK